MFDAGAVIGGVLGAIGSSAEAYSNYASTQLTNNANIAMNAENNAMNEALTREQWSRDDSSIRRRVADLRAAGLNPVLAAGTGAQSSAPISMQAGRAIAPQLSGLSGALGKGVATYADIVRAKELKEQSELDTETKKWNLAAARDTVMKVLPSQAAERYAQQRQSELSAQEREYNLNWYRANNLPTNAGNTEATKIAQARALIKDAVRKGSGGDSVVLSGILDLLGGN